MPRWLRIRTPYIALALSTIAIGLLVTLRGGALTPAVRDILGDALWAAMMTWWVSAAAPSIPVALRAAAAIAISFAVELSQLVQTPALDAIRRTTPGSLVLGSGFDPRDLAAYTAGVLAAALLERALRRTKNEMGSEVI